MNEDDRLQRDIAAARLVLALDGEPPPGGRPDLAEIAAWQAGELPPARAAEVLAHVARDPECYRLWYELRREQQVGPVSADRAEDKPQWWRSWWQALRVAPLHNLAYVALIAFVAVMIWPILKVAPVLDTPPAGMQEEALVQMKSPLDAASVPPSKVARQPASRALAPKMEEAEKRMAKRQSVPEVAPSYPAPLAEVQESQETFADLAGATLGAAVPAPVDIGLLGLRAGKAYAMAAENELAMSLPCDTSPCTDLYQAMLAIGRWAAEVNQGCAEAGTTPPPKLVQGLQDALAHYPSAKGEDVLGILLNWHAGEGCRLLQLLLDSAD